MNAKIVATERDELQASLARRTYEVDSLRAELSKLQLIDARLRATIADHAKAADVAEARLAVVVKILGESGVADDPRFKSIFQSSTVCEALNKWATLKTERNDVRLYEATLQEQFRLRDALAAEIARNVEQSAKRGYSFCDKCKMPFETQFDLSTHYLGCGGGT